MRFRGEGTCAGAKVLEFCFRSKALFDMEGSIMRPLRLLLLVCFCLGLGSAALLGGEYRLNNGDIIRGEPVSFDDDGVVVRLQIGGHSPRIGWSKLSQESLKELSKDPAAARFAEPFIEIPPAPKEKTQRREIRLKPVPRVERVEKPNFFASFLTPAGLAIFGVLFLGNLYAAYEIARYRHRPPGLVCGLAVVLPVIAPALFLALPSTPADEDEAGAPEPALAGQAAGKATTGSLAKVPMASGLSIAQEKSGGAGGSTAPQSYKRGEFTFNRRFMETKFPGLFRVVQSEADKDMVLSIRTSRDEYIAKRISRISSNEMHVQLLKGGAEVSVAFSEIMEVHLRHKDAKA